MRRRGSTMLDDTRGAAVIEFAILTPVFLMLMTGMLAYAIYFGTAHALQQLAADAVRVSLAGLTSQESRDLVEAYIRNNASSYMLIDERRLVRTVSAIGNDGVQMRLVLRYDASALPIWNLYPPLPLPDDEIVTATTIRRSVL